MMKSRTEEINLTAFPFFLFLSFCFRANPLIVRRGQNTFRFRPTRSQKKNKLPAEIAPGIFGLYWQRLIVTSFNERAESDQRNEGKNRHTPPPLLITGPARFFLVVVPNRRGTIDAQAAVLAAPAEPGNRLAPSEVHKRKQNRFTTAGVSIIAWDKVEEKASRPPSNANTP